MENQCLTAPFIEKSIHSDVHQGDIGFAVATVVNVGIG